ncbi:DUF106 domain-containing protein [Haladaptatus cibarius]|uniref:DUF106 domain-containing protein n=1 Tax=Haladaptatus cibarius TaxID=453847 RepID=UPI0006791A9D|nr:EMC3/TMCO1 family protein [Haladaptatus cibarius]
MESKNGGSWSKYDKLAGLLAVGLFTGYFVQPIEAAIVTVVSPLLSPLAVWLPFSLFMFTLAGTTGLYTAILQTKLRDTERMERLQEKMKTLQENVKTARKEGDEDELDDLREEQQELMQSQLKMMKSSVRPMVWSLLVTAPAFIWLRWVLTSPAAAITPVAFFFPVIGQIAWTATIVGPLQVWLVWYIGASISSGYVSRKIVQRVA